MSIIEPPEQPGDDNPGTLFQLPSDSFKVTSDDCYTPKWVFDAMGLEFDLDVAAPPMAALGTSQRGRTTPPRTMGSPLRGAAPSGATLHTATSSRGRRSSPSTTRPL